MVYSLIEEKPYTEASELIFALKTKIYKAALAVAAQELQVLRGNSSPA